VSIPNGPSALAVKEAAWGLARYAAISQVREMLVMLLERTLLDVIYVVFLNWLAVNSNSAT
jgi:hypothetical protein